MCGLFCASFLNFIVMRMINSWRSIHDSTDEIFTVSCIETAVLKRRKDQFNHRNSIDVPLLYVIILIFRKLHMALVINTTLRRKKYNCIVYELGEINQARIDVPIFCATSLRVTKNFSTFSNYQHSKTCEIDGTGQS